MIALFELLIYGHLHKWEVLEVNPCSDELGSKWNKYTCKCAKCGRIKAFHPI